MIRQENRNIYFKLNSRDLSFPLNYIHFLLLPATYQFTQSKHQKSKFKAYFSLSFLPPILLTPHLFVKKFGNCVDLFLECYLYPSPYRKTRFSMMVPLLQNLLQVENVHFGQFYPLDNQFDYIIVIINLNSLSPYLFLFNNVFIVCSGCSYLSGFYFHFSLSFQDYLVHSLNLY